MLERYSNHNNLALLGIRLSLGFLWLIHGISKLLTPQGTQEFFASLGFPGVVGLLIGAIELVGGTLLIAGLLTRVVVVPLIGIITVAMLLVQIQNPGDLPLGVSTGIERDLLFFFGMFVLLSFGPGKYSIDSRYPKLQLIQRYLSDDSGAESKGTA
jgi:putative oxidoreductase